MAKIERDAANALRALAERIDEEPLEVQEIRYEKEGSDTLGDLYVTWSDVGTLLEDSHD